jgi:DNA-binding response OmpR family regulator
MSGIRVLLVDDEEELVSTLSERLSLRGIAAEAATSGHAALEMMRGRPFDIVVLDLKMPHIDGMEVLKALKREHPGIKVILITGHGSAYDDETPDIESADDVLLKPFDIDTLVQRIGQNL